MAVINGAKTVEDVVRTVKSGFFTVIRVRPFSSRVAAHDRLCKGELGRLPPVDGDCSAVHSG